MRKSDQQVTSVETSGGFELDWEAVSRTTRRLIEAQLRGRPREDIEDTVSEALISLLRTLQREEPRNLEALIVANARRRVIDYIRRITNRPVHEEIPESLPSASGALLESVEIKVRRFRFVILEFFERNNTECARLARSFFAEESWKSVASSLAVSHAVILQRWKRCVDRLRGAGTFREELADFLPD